LEFQRRIAAENISYTGQKQTKSPKTPQQGDAGKEKGSGERKQKQNSPKIGGPFQRAKSWNVKQQSEKMKGRGNEFANFRNNSKSINVANSNSIEGKAK
jgi:hypothetical protein